MQCLNFFIPLYLVIAIQVIKGAILNTPRNSTRVKRAMSNINNSQEVKYQPRQDAPWSWGEAEDVKVTERLSTFPPLPPKITPLPGAETSTRRFQDILASIQQPEICREEYKPPGMPDFSKPGRRMSEQKCYEYIWDIKKREDFAKYWNTCYSSISIINGRQTKPGEFPHMAAVGWKASQGTWIFKCGGSLISPKFVLTAAHCSRTSDSDTTVADPVPKIVRLGDKNIIDVEDNGVQPMDKDIIKIINHPQYKSPMKYYDLSLMELKNDVIFSNLIQPTCLWTKFDTKTLGTKATITGWGVTDTAKRTTSPTLQAAEIDILPSKTCDDLLIPMTSRHWKGMDKHQICAGILAGGIDSCQGDSGGPLQVRINLPPSPQGAMHHLIGITSFGFGCALPNTPGVYTRASSFIDWIESIVWK